MCPATPPTQAALAQASQAGVYTIANTAKLIYYKFLWDGYKKDYVNIWLFTGLISPFIFTFHIIKKGLVYHAVATRCGIISCKIPIA